MKLKNVYIHPVSRYLLICFALICNGFYLVFIIKRKKSIDCDEIGRLLGTSSTKKRLHNLPSSKKVRFILDTSNFTRYNITKTFVLWFRVFIEYNIPLPSSASIESVSVFVVKLSKKKQQSRLIRILNKLCF